MTAKGGYGVFTNIDCHHGSHPPFIPQPHQKEVLDYFLNKLKYKGLLLYHRLGSGKSCSSILISDEMITESKAKKIFVLTPGSLRQNFIEEYCDKCGKSPEFLKKHYTFITTNYAVGNRLPDFNNSMVIIDEIHNLINGVKNQSKHATLIYKALLKSNCKILALTGSPVYNFIWEWPLLGNLLKPDTFPDIIKHGELDKEAFMKTLSIDDEGNVTPKNPKLFDVQMRGIISYFPGVKGGFYPKVIHENPIQVRMTIPQDKTYWKIALWEEETRKQGPPTDKRSPTYVQDMNDFIIASKYIMSRLYSNFYYPKEIRSAVNPSTRDEIQYLGKAPVYKYLPTGKVYSSKQVIIDELYKAGRIKAEKAGRPKKDDKTSVAGKIKEDNVKLYKAITEKVNNNVTEELSLINIGWINNEDFDNKKLVDFYSRKITALIINVLNNWKAKHMVFTFFKTKSGVNLIHSLFKLCGINTAIYSGDISDSQRRIILKNFNAEKNRYGGKIKILLVTEAGAEGINLLETQHIHILESSTREMKIQQAIGRVVRFRSHMVPGRTPMPIEEQVVHVHRYWSISSSEPVTISKTIRNKKGETEKIDKLITNKITVDQALYEKGRISVNMLQSFLSLIKNSSVTSFDKSQEKDLKLKHFDTHTPSERMLKAYKISDERYLEHPEPIIDEYVPDSSDFESVSDEETEAVTV